MKVKHKVLILIYEEWVRKELLIERNYLNLLIEWTNASLFFLTMTDFSASILK